MDPCTMSQVFPFIPPEVFGRFFRDPDPPSPMPSSRSTEIQEATSAQATVPLDTTGECHD